MNTLDPGCVERLRQEAIIESKRRNRANGGEDNVIELTQEFRDLFSDRYFPLCKLR